MNTQTVAMMVLKGMDLMLLYQQNRTRAEPLVEEFRSRLADMAHTGREPTAREWEQLNADIDAELGRLLDR